MGRTARISDGPFEHFDASPVRRIWVSNPLHTQPLTETGPPPPLPGALPDASAGRVGPLDRHGRPAAHRPLPHIYQHRDARRSLPGTALAAGRGGHGRLRGRGHGHAASPAGRRAPRERASGECGHGKHGGPSRRQANGAWRSPFRAPHHAVIRLRIGGPMSPGLFSPGGRECGNPVTRARAAVARLHTSHHHA